MRPTRIRRACRRAAATTRKCTTHAAAWCTRRHSFGSRPQRSAMAELKLRRATTADARWLDLWDTDPEVIACSTDDPDATVAFGDTEWTQELAAQDEYSQYF